MPAGTVTASKGVVVDSNKDIASFRNITLTGELDAGSLDVSGDIDVDGTTNLDAVDSMVLSIWRLHSLLLMMLILIQGRWFRCSADR